MLKPMVPNGLMNYHGRCRECKTSYYYYYQDNIDGSRIYYDNEGDKQFLMLSLQLAFSCDLLKYIDGMVDIGAMSFERTTKVYNHIIGS